MTDFHGSSERTDRIGGAACFGPGLFGQTWASLDHRDADARFRRARKDTSVIDRAGIEDALRRPSAWVLVAVNLGLIFGVVAWDWQVFDIVFLYWAENLVIGVINVLKMIAASPVGALQGSGGRFAAQSVAGNALKFFLVPFFIVHYGGFCYGHGIFIFSLFHDNGLAGGVSGIEHAGRLLNGNMLLAVSLLAASHLFSFVRNYILGGEYRNTNAAALMMRPYGRIVALHITIIFGGFLTMAFGSPVGLLVILMVLKTAVDLGMHQSERRKLQGL